MWWMISVLSGSSVSTLLLEAAQDEGADHRPQHRHVLGILDRLAKAALELAEAAEQARVDEGEQAPQLPRWFSMGVPERARRKSPSSWNSSLARWVPAFLICCASSSTMLDQRRDLSAWERLPSMP